MSERLSSEAVMKVARLARLAITPGQAERYGEELSKILAYVERLRGLDLSGVEPMATPLDTPAPLGADREGGEAVTNAALMAMAPEVHEPFVRVPKVLGEGGGA
jgi:aspartyl-tRNA(Asn)/glutamyl-tRNA(Gln) amidotransferase subunit C